MPLAIVRDVAKRCRSGDLKPWEEKIKEKRGLDCEQLGEAVASIVENSRAKKAAEQDLQPISRELIFKRHDAEKHLAFGEVYVPNDIDTHGDFMTAEGIEALAHKFMLKLLNGNIDVMHDNKTGRAAVVESFIARDGDPDFMPGSWVLGLKIFDEDTWKQIKNGELTGLSFEAMVRKIPAKVKVDHDGQAEGRTSTANDHFHTFKVALDDRGSVRDGTTDRHTDDHRHRIVENGRTQEVERHRHTFSLGRHITERVE